MTGVRASFERVGGRCRSVMKKGAGPIPLMGGGGGGRWVPRRGVSAQGRPLRKVDRWRHAQGRLMEMHRPLRLIQRLVLSLRFVARHRVAHITVIDVVGGDWSGWRYYLYVVAPGWDVVVVTAVTFIEKVWRVRGGVERAVGRSGSKSGSGVRKASRDGGAKVVGDGRVGGRFGGIPRRGPEMAMNEINPIVRVVGGRWKRRRVAGVESVRVVNGFGEVVLEDGGDGGSGCGDGGDGSGGGRVSDVVGVDRNRDGGDKLLSKESGYFEKSRRTV